VCEIAVCECKRSAKFQRSKCRINGVIILKKELILNCLKLFIKNYFYQSQQTVPSDQSEQTRLLETMSLERFFYLIRFCEKRGDVAIYEKSKVLLTFVAGVGDL